MYKSCIVDAMSDETLLRIGELSRRSGVSPELLRAWERRYGLLDPVRSSGGLRLYSLDQLARVRRMQGNLAQGIAAAEAAALARQDDTADEALRPALEIDAACGELADALASFDEPRAQAVLDRLLAVATVDTVVSDIALPYLHELGTRWQNGQASIAQEHFASSVLRGRLLGLARGWGRGLGPRIVLGTPPGEFHDLGLIAFGVLLRARGWRVAYLGADTPMDGIAEAAGALEPEFVVLAAVSSERFTSLGEPLRALARTQRLALGGDGAAELDPKWVDALLLTDDIVLEADRLTALVSADAARH
jgi:MerR family transcriptional regulator, light-induced transcriptional regulator